MKTRLGFAVASMVLLSACATSPSDSSGSSYSSGNTELIGSLLGLLLGGATSYKTGDVSQGQQVMNATWNAFGVGSADDSSADSSDSSSDFIASTVNSLPATAAGDTSSSTSGSPKSPFLKSALNQHFSFASSNCPSDLSGVKRHITAPDLLASNEGFSQTVTDMVQKAGGVDNAIALNAAQNIEYKRAALEAEQQAQDSYGGNGPIFDKNECAGGEGIYCSGVKMAWLYSDSLVIGEYVDALLQCNKSAGTVQ